MNEINLNKSRFAGRELRALTNLVAYRAANILCSFRGISKDFVRIEPLGTFT